MTARLILVGCGKAKLKTAAPARDLYTGNLFRAARGYAEAEVGEGWADAWGVVSARLPGIFWPGEVVTPYDNVIPFARRQQVAWLGWVRKSLVDAEVDSLDEVVVLAGRRYVDGVRRAVDDLVSVVAPLEGLQVGERLAWFKAKREERDILDGLVDDLLEVAMARFGHLRGLV